MTTLRSKTTFFALPVLMTLVFAVQGCSTMPRVSYEDPKKVEDIDIRFGATDLNLVAESMARSLLQSPVVANSGDLVLITLAPVKNKTREYIDTRAITEKIRVQMTKSDRVRFAVSISEMQSQTDELKRQNQSGMYKEDSINQTGLMQAARYRLEGSVSSIVKQSPNVKNVYYLFTLSLVDNKTGIVEWAEEQEIRKVEQR